jgi:hypothetical protein
MFCGGGLKLLPSARKVEERIKMPRRVSWKVEGFDGEDYLGWVFVNKANGSERDQAINFRDLQIHFEEHMKPLPQTSNSLL